MWQFLCFPVVGKSCTGDRPLLLRMRPSTQVLLGARSVGCFFFFSSFGYTRMEAVSFSGSCVHIRGSYTGVSVSKALCV